MNPSMQTGIFPEANLGKQLARDLERLRSKEKLDLGALIDMSARLLSSTATHPESNFDELASRLLKIGEPIIAYDVIEAALQIWPDHRRFLYFKALALARAGAAHGAHAIIAKLHAKGYRSFDTFCLLGRTHKDFCARAQDADDVRIERQRAHDAYKEAFLIAVPDYNDADARLTSAGSGLNQSQEKAFVKAAGDFFYAGINVATTALLLGDEAEAKDLALRVRDAVLLALKFDPKNFWAYATLGEADLILGDINAAKKAYLQAIDLGRGNWGDLGAVQKQACILREHVWITIDSLKIDFKIPDVVMFTGHMIDSPERALMSPRFPESLTGNVRHALRERLEKLGPCIAYCSAACGSDLLFADALLNLGQEVNLVLPFPKEQFRKFSVEDVTPNREWQELFDSVLERVGDRIVVLGEHVPDWEPLAFRYTNEVLTGLAILRARGFGGTPRGIAVWDGKPGGGAGGTQDLVDLWRRRNADVDIVEIDKLLAAAQDVQGRATIEMPLHAPLTPADGPKQVMRAMLFADVYHYSNLNEVQTYEFARVIMGGVADLIARTQHTPLTKNTWGDALYFVFENPRQAGLFALELLDCLEGPTNLLVNSPLPSDLMFRIGLHAGPVFECLDRILGYTNYVGKHVNRAARIEPITLPGHIFVSEPFAALSAVENITEFSCDYVGQRQLPKGEAIIKTYHLVRTGVGK